MEKALWIRFDGAAGGTFPATWGQREFWHTITKLRPSGFYQIPWAVPVPAGCPPERIERLLTALLHRYEALRTTLRRDPDGELWQVVHTEGELPVWTIELPPDREAVAASRALKDHMEAEPEVEKELPWRIVILTWNGVPHHVTCVCSHMVLDGQSGALLAAEMAGALTGDGTPGTEPVRQPSEVAAWESGTGGYRQARLARDHWRSVLTAAPPGPFPAATATGRSPLWRGLLRSEVTDTAEWALVRRTGIPSGAAFLTATAALLSHVTGAERLLFRVPSSNRFTPDLQRYVGALSQHAALIVDTRAGTFDELTRSVAGDLLRAYSRARYDADQMHALLDEVRAQGGQPDLTLLFNDIRTFQKRPDGAAPPVAATPAPGAGEVSWELLHTANPDLTLYVRVAAEEDRSTLDVAADTSCLSRPEIERFLLGLERLLAHAARGDIPLAGIGRVAGL